MVDSNESKSKSTDASNSSRNRGRSSGNSGNNKNNANSRRQYNGRSASRNDTKYDANGVPSANNDDTAQKDEIMNSTNNHSKGKKYNRRNRRGSDDKNQHQHHNPKNGTKSQSVSGSGSNENRDTKMKHNRQDGNNNTNHNHNKNYRNNIKSNDNRGQYQRKNSGNKVQYPDHVPLKECLNRYANKDKILIRGKLRVIPGGAMAFVSCDRGSYSRDVIIDGEMMRNRAMDGDNVFVKITGTASESNQSSVGESKETDKKKNTNDTTDYDIVEDIKSKLNVDVDEYEYDRQEDVEGDSDDDVQRSLWDPVVHIPKATKNKARNNDNGTEEEEDQYTGEIICIILPKMTSLPGSQPSEINPSKLSNSRKSNVTKTIVGTIMPMNGNNNNRCLLVPNSRCLPRFMTPSGTRAKFFHGENEQLMQSKLCRAEYIYGSWSSNDKWPPCVSIKLMGDTCNVEDETIALLIEHGVDSSDFSPDVLRDVETAVSSGRTNSQHTDDLGWEPTEEMLKGRRDYRNERIFTIDPTTAKDLDDALHIKPLPNGRVEIGVHIADVSHFVQPETNVDEEASRRTTTVYLVDRTVPMLPRPLCEIACSLNENVERLAFSCVWTMNKDGTLAKKDAKGKGKVDDVWYGRTVIKSCARLDYATAQNIIDRKVATGEKYCDEAFWPKSRQPTGKHSIDEVAADVRLMHTVAMSRRKLRFENGALALNGVKLTFQLESDGQTPALCAPYPIRDSNRLIEEYMLIANYLVAQRLITHAGGLAVLRQHQPPMDKGLQNVLDIAKEIGFIIDGTTSKSLQESLSKMGRECKDTLAIQCITEMLMTPMQPAEYIAAGNFEPDEWHHFALNIPYYTHFTSPIRRYPDVLVHRLLQATLDGPSTVQNYKQSESETQSICDHCNDKRMKSKKAQDRSDRVFLSLFLKAQPIKSTLGVVVSVGEKAFTVFVPDLGVTTKVYLDEHRDIYDVHVQQNEKGQRRMFLVPINGHTGPKLDIKLFQKITVSCHCKEKPPIDVSLKIVGLWKDR